MKILGLDLGIGSIGWCLIETDENKAPKEIIAIGSRIIRLSPDEIGNFERGRGETVCSQRTMKRTARKCNNRYKLRRARLKAILNALGMYDEEAQRDLKALHPLALWELRSKAATPGERISLQELGRVLLHLNQKRGYRHAKEDSGNKEQTDYVKAVNERYNKISDLEMTVGQYHYSNLKSSAIKQDGKDALVTHSLKNEVFPRNAYLEEFNRIMEVQSAIYPDILNETGVNALREAIFYQRPLKSCKHLVSTCEFECRTFTNKDGKKITSGPKVAPRTSPIAEVTRLYEVINNIRLFNSANRKRSNNMHPMPSLFDNGPLSKDLRLLQYEYKLDNEERSKIFDYLNSHEQLTATGLLKLLGLKKADGFIPDKAVGKGIKGNATRVKIADALGMDLSKNTDSTYGKLMQFDIPVSEYIDTETGEIKPIVSSSIIEEPFYKLWHTLYSIPDTDELSKVLKEKFSIEDEDVIKRLSSLDLVSPGFSNRSAKFMRKLLPFLIEGKVYSEAAAEVGINHSASITKEENDSRELKPRLTPLLKNSLRQPVVEKILNQMINIVNTLIDRYGEIDEARIELARQLKQSKDERLNEASRIAKKEKENTAIAKRISEEYGLAPSRRRIQKYRLWEETGHTCMYCGKPVGAGEFLNSHGAEVEHIIPRTLYFDDSMSNKTCACAACNKEKNNRTAMDFMNSKSEQETDTYITRVESLYAEGTISKKKRNYLLMTSSEIPTDFIDRDLRQSQYISRKAIEILKDTIRNVWASSGTVTDFFRHAWGYDRILHDLNIYRYAKAGLVKDETFEHHGQTHVRKAIEGWSKRLDHRHHAIDALVIALTSQGYIQRLNNLSSEHGNIFDELKSSDSTFKRNHSLLSQWAESRPHFPTAEVSRAVDNILVSFKAGKKSTTPGKRKIRIGNKWKLVQPDILVPRGPLHKESVYGRIMLPGKKEKLAFAFEHPKLIVDNKIRSIVEQRIEKAGGDRNAALKSVSKDPIMLSVNGEETKIKEVNCYHDEFVIKYNIADFKIGDISSIVDEGIKRKFEQRAAEVNNNDKEFKKSLITDPIKGPDNLTVIKSVRCKTGIKPESLAAVKYDEQRKAIGFAQTRNNHHIGIYRMPDGTTQHILVSFWDVIKRRLHRLPAIISDPEGAWDMAMNIPDEEERECICSKLPDPRSQFVESLAVNDMFILGMTDEEFEEAIHDHNYAELQKHLYRIQKLSEGIYYFRFHTATNTNETEREKVMNDFIRTSSVKAYVGYNPRKLMINTLGEIMNN